MKRLQFLQIIMDSSFKENFFNILFSIFIASLITCNLIANKFVTVDLGFKTFVVSAGILAYPITFIVTDLISELYGQKKANKVVFSGFIASIFVLIFLLNFLTISCDKLFPDVNLLNCFG